MGKVIFQRLSHLVQPSMSAASYILIEMVCSPDRKIMIWIPEEIRKSGGYLLRKTVMGYGVSICRAILLFGLCFLILQPLLNKISVSFMTEGDLWNIAEELPYHIDIKSVLQAHASK